MDIDCDGQVTSRCNEDTDPWFQDDTAFHQSDGEPLIADKLPYVVVPSPSSTWDYTKSGIKGGGVVAVIYNNKVQYAVVGDTGPTNIIGEASYATANALGIDPDPETGGAESGVTYIVFKNSSVSRSRTTTRPCRSATVWRSSSSRTTDPATRRRTDCGARPLTAVHHCCACAKRRHRGARPEGRRPMTFPQPGGLHR
ncbi:hypothetical protein GCM10017744_015370 [Streptomyces antimycoticus]